MIELINCLGPCYRKLIQPPSYPLVAWSSIQVTSMGAPSTPQTKPEVVTVTTADEVPVQLEAAGCTDRGLRAWTVVVGAWCANLCGFGWVNCELASLFFCSRHYTVTLT